MSLAPQIWKIEDAVRSGAVAGLPPEDLQAALDLLSSSLIELFERPSEKEGHAGYIGSSAKQRDMQRAFFEGNAKVYAAAGSNQCIGADTLIPSPDGECRRVADIKGKHWIWAWDGKRQVRALAGEPVITDHAECFEVILSNGHTFQCSREHLLLTTEGWRTFGSLLQSAPSLHPSSSGLCPPAFPEDDPRSTRIAQGSQAGCLGGHRFDGGRLLSPSDTGPDGVPLQADASAPCHFFGGTGATVPRQSRIHPGRCEVHHSNWDGPDRYEAHGAESVSRGACTASTLGPNNIEGGRRPAFESGHQVQSTCELDESAIVSSAAFVSPNGASTSIVSIRSLGIQPIYDFHVPVYNNYVAAGIVHHNCGKTECIGGMCFAKWLRDKAQDGEEYWVIAQSIESMRGVPMQTLWRFLPRAMFPPDVEYIPKLGFGQIPTLQLKLPGGRGVCTVRFKTEEQDLKEFESARLAGAWWTECRKEAIYDAIQLRFSKSGGWLLMDYIAVEFWHKARLRLDKTGMVFWRHFTMADNAHNLAAGTIERMKATLTEDQFRLRVLGEEVFMEGVVYHEFRESKHVIPSFTVPREWPRWRALDYGGSSPTACVWGTVAPMGWTDPLGRYHAGETRIIYREYYERGGSIAVHAEAVKVKSGTEQYRGPMLIDPAAYAKSPANERTIAEQYGMHGLPCQGWPRTSQIGEDATVEFVKAHLVSDPPDLLVMDCCQNLIGEFQQWQYQKNRDGELKPDNKYENAHNHALDAMRGWLMTKPMGGSYAIAQAVNTMDDTDDEDFPNSADARYFERNVAW